MVAQFADGEPASALRTRFYVLEKAMSRLRIFFVPLLAALVVTACAVAQEVKTDYDHHANFSQYHTYCWEKVKTTDPLWEGRIQEAVDHSLQAKGWQRVDTGDNRCDVAVTAVGSAHNQREYQTFYDGLGGWRWGGFGETTTEQVNYPVGSLVVDLYDTHNKQLIWRGVSSEALSNNPEKNEKKLDKAVDKMFDHFPPK
jgi:hypothetical protein